MVVVVVETVVVEAGLGVVGLFLPNSLSTSPRFLVVVAGLRVVDFDWPSKKSILSLIEPLLGVLEGGLRDGGFLVVVLLFNFFLSAPLSPISFETSLFLQLFRFWMH